MKELIIGGNSVTEIANKLSLVNYRKGKQDMKRKILKILEEHEHSTYWNGMNYEDKEYIKKIKNL